MEDTSEGQAHRSWTMAQVRAKDTKPEMVVRRTVHSLGYRYRLHGAKLPGKPDLVFSRQKKAIFVHGCFWHQHSDLNCRKSRLPKSRLDYWLPKLKRNKERDLETEITLEAMGWKVLTVWECQLKDVEALKRTLIDFLGTRPPKESNHLPARPRGGATP
jgi:DNA mismatch endonuclease (patch repair protein)